MDPAARPQSIIGSACQALISRVRQVSADVTNFVRRCHSSRTDLAPVMRELSELQMVLQLLNDFESQIGAVPEELQSHLGPIIHNCIAVVSKVHEVLRRQEAAGWTVEARNEVGELSKSLSVHRGVMGLVSDLISIVVSRGTRPGDEDRSEICALLEELRTMGLSMVITYSNASLAREHFALQVHLGQIITYTETLAQADLWQDAVKTLDAAQRKASMDHLQHEVRRSVPLPAPLIRGHSADKQVVAAGIRNSGLENLLQLGDPDANDPNRPPSMFFTPTPNKSSEQKPAATIESAGPSGTGFIVMDGFFNSTHGTGTSPKVPFYGERERLYPSKLGVPGSEPAPSRRSFEYQDSAEQSITRQPSTAHSSSKPLAVRASASGLQLHIPSEKELVAKEPVSDEALAFAQVPIHVLDRLSVNLVGHVYAEASPTDSPRRSQSQSVTRSYRDSSARENSDAASTSTSHTRGLRDGNLEFSQIQSPQISPGPTSHPQSSTTSNSQTLVNYQRSPHDSPNTPSRTSPNIGYQGGTPAASDNGLHTVTTHRSVTSVRSSPVLPSQQSHMHPVGRSGLRAVDSMSTMNSHLYMAQKPMSQKPLPRAPMVYIPGYPGPFIKKKVVVVGNFSCGKTCMITRMARNEYPRNKNDEMRITETVKLSVDESPIELCLWDIRGIDYDPSWLHNAHVALVCFSVNIGSTDSKGKHLGRWVAEVNRNCPGAAILLVGLKADIRFHAKSVEKLARTGKALVTPEQGEQFRENIGAQRYVECSARTGEGVMDVLSETARVALQVHGHGKGKKGAAANAASSSARTNTTPTTDGGKNKLGSMRGRRPLSRIGKFFGMSGQD